MAIGYADKGSAADRGFMTPESKAALKERVLAEAGKHGNKATAELTDLVLQVIDSKDPVLMDSIDPGNPSVGKFLTPEANQALSEAYRMAIEAKKGSAQ